MRALIVALLLAGCATAARVPAPMDCARDGIDRKLCEWNCRNTGGTWTGAACTR